MMNLERLTRWLRYNLMYLGKPPWDTGTSPPELIEFIQQHKPGRAIDLGCGTGTNMLTLAEAGWLVTGVDFAIKAVLEAKSKLMEVGIPGEVRSGDVSRLEVVEGEYDLALDIGCYHGLATNQRERYRRNLLEILKPGGYYLLYAHWLQPGTDNKIGISPTEFDAFCADLALESRQDSQDRWGRPVSWLCFRAWEPVEGK